MIRNVRSRIDALKPRACWRPLDFAELPLLKLVERVRLGGRVDTPIALITRAGEHGAVWYLIAGVASAVDEPRGERWRQAGFAAAAAYLVGSAMKMIARRGRPPLASIGTETALSFPSLHAATSFAAARAFAELLPEPFDRAPFAAATAVTASRLHFCVHYPSDLVAGALLGDAIGRATVARWRAEDSSAKAAARAEGARLATAALATTARSTAAMAGGAADGAAR
ncbi:MAG: phosphatase PAP2 family protein [Actinobacteria bacterium]|nr:phosphatase PAP2 family protein [Actinomycetota bacterium]